MIWPILFLIAGFVAMLGWMVVIEFLHVIIVLLMMTESKDVLVMKIEEVKVKEEDEE